MTKSIPQISNNKSRVYICRKGCFGGLILGRTYYRRQFCASKWVWLLRFGGGRIFYEGLFSGIEEGGGAYYWNFTVFFCEDFCEAFPIPFVSCTNKIATQ